MSFFSSSSGWGIGSLLNNVTGVTQSGINSQKYALQSMALNNKYQKEFAQNAHQWEIQDLKKAGLNPVLSAGGAGASASGGGVNSGAQASASINPLEAGIGAWQGIEEAQRTGAEAKNLEANSRNADMDTMLKEAQMWETRARTAKTETERKLAEAKIAETYENIDLIRKNVKKAQAETKYTDERARGHSFTTSQNVSGPLGTGGGGTISKTW